jgi:lariat debranching enzyme
MSCPVKYREIGDFHSYYEGSTRAPYLTIFVGGNHEASNHLWELYYGGWVAPNIYYMGAANVVRLGGVRISGMSGIWKGYNFNKSHYERLPYSADDVKSIYHLRELDTRKLLQLRTQVDIGISHDWPRAIEKYGNSRALFNMKADFEQESKDGTLGNLAATYVMDRLRPPYWFAAHMHCKFAATRTYEDTMATKDATTHTVTKTNSSSPKVPIEPAVIHNTDEIDLDMDDDETPTEQSITVSGSSVSQNQEEISLDEEDESTSSGPAPSAVPEDLRAQLPAAFQKPAPPSQRQQPGQPTPPDITNKTVRFLALDKCLPGRKFLQLLEVTPYVRCASLSTSPEAPASRPKPKFEYDPEWLAITRAFASDLVLGDKSARPLQNPGEAHYRPLIEKEQLWINEHLRSSLDHPRSSVKGPWNIIIRKCSSSVT